METGNKPELWLIQQTQTSERDIFKIVVQREGGRFSDVWHKLFVCPRKLDKVSPSMLLQGMARSVLSPGRHLGKHAATTLPFTPPGTVSAQGHHGSDFGRATEQAVLQNATQNLPVSATYPGIVSPRDGSQRFITLGFSN